MPLAGKKVLERKFLRSVTVRRPHDCYDHLHRNGRTTSDKMRVYLGFAEQPLNVYCDMTTDAGGWTVGCVTVGLLAIFNRK